MGVLWNFYIFEWWQNLCFSPYPMKIPCRVINRSECNHLHRVIGLFLFLLGYLANCKHGRCMHLLPSLILCYNDYRRNKVWWYCISEEIYVRGLLLYPRGAGQVMTLWHCDFIIVSFPTYTCVHLIFLIKCYSSSWWMNSNKMSSFHRQFTMFFFSLHTKLRIMTLFCSLHTGRSHVVYTEL